MIGVESISYNSHFVFFGVYEPNQNSKQHNKMHVDPNNAKQAAAIIAQGNLCAFATETVYGLGADASNSDAVLKIYETKGRPRFNPLIAHCADIKMAQSFAHFNALALGLAQEFWPGPVTFVLPARSGTGISDIVTAGLDTIAIRVPSHPMAREIISNLGRPIAAPSANPSGKLSPTTAQHVRLNFNGMVPVLDGGPCTSGVESTIIAIDGNDVIQLRAGALARSEIESFLGQAIAVAETNSAITAPGMLKSHYAPNAQIRLNVTTPLQDEAYLGFGGMKSDSEHSLNLSETANLSEAARNLFAYLACLDATGVASIAVAPIPFEGLGEAINDRLERAAAPRT